MKLTLKSIGMAAALVAGLATLSVAGTGSKEPMSPERVKFSTSESFRMHNRKCGRGEGSLRPSTHVKDRIEKN